MCTFSALIRQYTSVLPLWWYYNRLNCYFYVSSSRANGSYSSLLRSVVFTRLLVLGTAVSIIAAVLFCFSPLFFSHHGDILAVMSFDKWQLFYVSIFCSGRFSRTFFWLIQILLISCMTELVLLDESLLDLHFYLPMFSLPAVFVSEVRVLFTVFLFGLSWDLEICSDQVDYPVFVDFKARLNCS